VTRERASTAKRQSPRRVIVAAASSLDRAAINTTIFSDYQHKIRSACTRRSRGHGRRLAATPPTLFPAVLEHLRQGRSWSFGQWVMDPLIGSPSQETAVFEHGRRSAGNARETRELCAGHQRHGSSGQHLIQQRALSVPRPRAELPLPWLGEIRGVVSRDGVMKESRHGRRPGRPVDRPKRARADRRRVRHQLDPEPPSCRSKAFTGLSERAAGPRQSPSRRKYVWRPLSRWTAARSEGGDRGFGVSGGSDRQLDVRSQPATGVLSGQSTAMLRGRTRATAGRRECQYQAIAPAPRIRRNVVTPGETAKLGRNAEYFVGSMTRTVPT
jgi:hypothetical protein